MKVTQVTRSLRHSVVPLSPAIALVAVQLIFFGLPAGAWVRAVVIGLLTALLAVGMALVYRAHFAFIRNPITNSNGVNTSAIYGFANTLLTIIERESPTHLAVAFDTSAPTSRHKTYPEYKAQREAMPEELAAAIPEVK